MLFATLLLILNWKVNVFYLLETTASNICQLKLAVMKAKRLTAGSTNSLQQLLRFFFSSTIVSFCDEQSRTIRAFVWKHMLFSVKLAGPTNSKGLSRHLPAIFFRITWILKITSFCHIRLNIKTLKLFPVVCCNEWQGSCHGHGMKLGQRFQVFFCLQKSQKSG